MVEQLVSTGLEDFEQYAAGLAKRFGLAATPLEQVEHFAANVTRISFAIIGISTFHISTYKGVVSSAKLDAEKSGHVARSAVEELGMSHPGRQSDDIVTVSVGVVSPASSVCTSASLLEAADQALYRSKNAGRNRVTIAGAQPSGYEHSVTAAA